MHGERAALVLDHRSGMRIHQRRHGTARAAELGIDEARALHRSGSSAPFHAMQTGRGHSKRSEKDVEVLDAASAHQRHRAPQTLRNIAQQGLECRVRERVHRRVLQLDESAVDVEKQTPFERGRGRRLHRASVPHRRGPPDVIFTRHLAWIIAGQAVEFGNL